MYAAAYGVYHMLIRIWVLSSHISTRTRDRRHPPGAGTSFHTPCDTGPRPFVERATCRTCRAHGRACVMVDSCDVARAAHRRTTTKTGRKRTHTDLRVRLRSGASPTSSYTIFFTFTRVLTPAPRLVYLVMIHDVSLPGRISPPPRSLCALRPADAVRACAHLSYKNK